MTNTIQPEVLDLFKKSFEKAVAQELLKNDSNQGKVQSELEKLAELVQTNRKSELSAINRILKLIGKSSSDETVKSKSVKLSDEQILSKVQEILANGVKKSQSQIQKELGLSYPKFKQFLAGHIHLFGKEGSKKTSVLFLK